MAEALSDNQCPSVRTVFVMKRTENLDDLHSNDIILDEAISNIDDTCDPEPMSSEDPLFILYTSGSTGKIMKKKIYFRGFVFIVLLMIHILCNCGKKSFFSMDFSISSYYNVGKPKGLTHSTAGYLTYAGFTQKQAFSYFDSNDVFGCVADIGWITGIYLFTIYKKFMTVFNLIKKFLI